VVSESEAKLGVAGDEASFLLDFSFLVRDTLASSLRLGGAVDTYVLVSSIGFPSSSASSI
jgi:hypothetical protein